MRTSSIFCIFCQFLDVIGQHSLVKRHGTYIFFERTFYWLSYPFYKIQKTVFDFEKYIFWQYPNFLWFLLMLAKTRGAMATNYIPVDSIWQVLPVDQVSWSQHWSKWIYRSLKNADIIKISLFWSIFERGRISQ